MCFSKVNLKRVTYGLLTRVIYCWHEVWNPHATLAGSYAHPICVCLIVSRALADCDKHNRNRLELSGVSSRMEIVGNECAITTMRMMYMTQH